ALGPGVLALVVEALRLAVDHDAEDDAVETRGDAAVELRRARVNRHRMTLRRVADGGDALVEQHAQHVAAIVRRAADEKVVGGLAPILLQPLDVRLETAAGGDEGLAAHLLLTTLVLDGGGDEEAVLDGQTG